MRPAVPGFALLALALVAGPAVAVGAGAPAAGTLTVQLRGFGGGRRIPHGPRQPSQPEPKPPETKPPDTGTSTTPAPGPAGEGPRYGLGVEDSNGALERGEGREALADYERVAPLFEQRGDLVNAVRAYANATYLSRRLGTYQRGIRAGQRALELFDKVGPSREMSRRRFVTSSALAQCYRLTGDTAEARRVLDRALAFARTLNHRPAASQAASIQRGLATIAWREGRLAEAARLAAESAAYFEDLVAHPPTMPPPFTEREKDQAYRHLAEGLALLGTIEMARGHVDAAEDAYRRGLRLAALAGQGEYEAEPLLGLGRVAVARKDWAAAIDILQKADALATKLKRVPVLMPIAQNLALAYLATGRKDDALAASRRAVQLVEQVRAELAEGSTRGSFVEDKQNIYELAVRVALEAGHPDEAFAFAESSRARAFLDLLGSQTTLSKGRTRALAEEEIRLRNRLAALRDSSDGGDEENGGAAHAAKVAEAERAYREFLDRVRKENREQASLMTVEPVTLAEVQGLLSADTTLLEYLVSPVGVVVWVIDRGHVEVVRYRAQRDALVTAVRGFRAAIADRLPVEQVASLSQALYAELFARVRPHVHTERVLIVPHDVLHYLPFAALRSPEGRWLVQDYTLATLPSASVLRYLAGKGQDTSDRVLAVGNPALGPALDLRYAEREARLVGRRFPHADVLVRQAATKARVEALSGAAGLIHFATHGELNEQDPMASALLLVPEGDDGGRLEVRELFGLDLHARLVVLSACETGLGKLSRGDELVGLQRAFLYAGTPAVITTLWKVDDRASYELVRAFYDRLPKSDPARALREAQIATAKRFAHPFAWAAFGLTGPAW